MALPTDSSNSPMDWSHVNLNNLGRYIKQDLAKYEGDSYLLDQWAKDEEEGGLGYTPERARQEISEPNMLIALLEDDDYGILEILSDRTACRALTLAILKRRVDVIEALIAAVKRLRVPKKRGPKGKMVQDQYLYERIFKLKEQGQSFRKIALTIYKDPGKANLVKAHYFQAKRKAAFFASAKRGK